MNPNDCLSQKEKHQKIIYNQNEFQKIFSFFFAGSQKWELAIRLSFSDFSVCFPISEGQQIHGENYRSSKWEMDGFWEGESGGCDLQFQQLFPHSDRFLNFSHFFFVKDSKKNKRTQWHDIFLYFLILIN